MSSYRALPTTEFYTLSLHDALPISTSEQFNLYAGETAVYVSKDQSLVGIIVLTDPLRETSRWTLKWLADHGVEQMVMVTGDMGTTAKAIAAEVGIEADRVRSEERRVGRGGACRRVR